MIRLRRIKPVFKDRRGSVYDIVEKKVGHVGVITSKRGAVRGNHYHKRSVQYTYVLSGTVRYTQKDTRGKTAKRESIILRPGDLVETPPLVAHSLKFLQDATILDITTKSRHSGGYEKDTIRTEL
jgi:quercetin dioxygenase-like cupin family protein